MKLSIILFLIFISISVSSQSIIKKNISIDPYLSFQNYEHFKRLTLSSPNSSIEYLDSFDFHWGYKYELSVMETELEYMLSDGTKYEYRFLKIISKTKMPESTQFNLQLEANRYYYKLDSSEQYMNATFKMINDSTYLYFDKVEIIVPQHLREKFDLIVKGKLIKTGKFIFIDNKQIKLIGYE